jgi:hypothetical protein
MEIIFAERGVASAREGRRNTHPRIAVAIYPKWRAGGGRCTQEGFDIDDLTPIET